MHPLLTVAEAEDKARHALYLGISRTDTNAKGPKIAIVERTSNVGSTDRPGDVAAKELKTSSV